ncbi:hypothetical protein AJ79_02580 [Helicocarpus griseus UAMH5409]|uniref:Uncharacterized protein n=1 Tax=Helicocarpus griseus UAMH5409 TaxID=1447875 RepID=A0A2B7Y1Z5_9EURO|nr:hypothetical protein AJ79_02580 [Helicocarpus griseus UAMH5409]
MDIQSFPEEVFSSIIEQLVLTIGICKALRLSVVNRYSWQNLALSTPAKEPQRFLSRIQKKSEDDTEFDQEIQGLNILCGAVVIGDLPLVKSLLETQSTCAKQAAINDESPYFGRPLQLAACWGHIEIVKYLLDNGSNPQLVTGDDNGGFWDRDFTNLGLRRHVYRSAKGTALQAAALGGHEATVRLLLEPEYRLHLPSMIGWYHRAILAGARGSHRDIINILLQNRGAKHLRIGRP